MSFPRAFYRQVSQPLPMFVALHSTLFQTAPCPSCTVGLGTVLLVWPQQHEAEGQDQCVELLAILILSLMQANTT